MASDTWWRFYNTAMDHPKVLQLNDTQFRAWMALNSLASKLGGFIPNDIDLIAKTLRKSEGKTREILQVLLSIVLLDCMEDGSYKPHNWAEKQFKSDVSTERVKRFRNRRRNVSETDHRQSTETETETEKKKVTPRAMRAEFEEVFWSGYPKKVGKEAAFKAYLKARLLADAPIIEAGTQRYALSRSGQDAQYTAHPATWLNAGRWNDEVVSEPVASAEVISIRSAFQSPEELEGQRRMMEKFHGKTAN